MSNNTPGSGFSPDISGSVKVLHGVAGPSGSALWFDTSNFSQPNAGGLHWGNVGRNIISGPSLRNLDFSVFRKFQVTERWRGELRFESFNFTNTPNFAQPNTRIGDTNFGRVTGAVGVNDGGGPRVVQLGMKLTF